MLLALDRASVRSSAARSEPVLEGLDDHHAAGALRRALYGEDVSGQIVADISGSSLDGRLIGRLVEAIRPWASVRSDLIFANLSEAIGNVVEHAYCDTGPALGRQAWRASAELMSDGGTLVLSVSDEGVGIPGSLRRRAELAGSNVGPGLTDADLIFRAIQEAGATDPYRRRGQGLPGMRSLVDSWPDAALLIHSLGGACRYSQAGAEAIVAAHRHGSHVQFILPLPQAGRP